ncbi:hypothetical protein [Desulfofustis limnaeus]|uniref:Uncharacterized protein n=1 Tax=Desulfofustis limnaeus TaxID=2740163 RepID=A0ABM7WCM9_9BACT|nr:hypothetical protein [Desulfofustis limnaeus]BDD88697.1 hypothetical protein DPPLL_30620 [Desulfofustis limnaeus]
MSNPSLLAVYRAPEVGLGPGTQPGPEDGSWLRLEQAPLEGPASGMNFGDWYRAKYGATEAASWAQMMAYYEEWRSYCNEEGEFVAEIRVHKSAPDLPYRLDATRGRWQHDHAQSADDQKTEQLAIRGEASASITGENVVRIVCAQWEGNVYDELGAVIYPRPQIQADTETWVLSWGRPVTGTLRVIFVVEYDVWFLAISPRTVSGDSVGSYAGEGGEGTGGGSSDDGSGYGVAVCTESYDEDDQDTVYAATVYGVYAGGIEELAVETPDLEGNCKGGGGGDDDDDDEPEPECYKLKVKYHKCTGKKTSENLIRVPCPNQSNES